MHADSIPNIFIFFRATHKIKLNCVIQILNKFMRYHYNNYSEIIFKYIFLNNYLIYILFSIDWKSKKY